MLLRYKRFWLVLLAPASWALTAAAHRWPDAAERRFSRGIYPWLAAGWGRVFGLLPFSAAQFLIILLPGLAVFYIVYMLRRIRRNPETRRRNTALLVSSALCATGVVWFLFTALCGLNYARESFADSAGFRMQDSSAAELEALCAELVSRVSGSAALVERDAQGRMVAKTDDYTLANQARDAYAALAVDYPVLGGFTPRPKPVLYSRFMSRIDIVGIYIPFTMEANVNVDVCDYEIPSSMCHELAHFKGFMREDEANFIAYLACEASGNPDFVYSGQMLALVHVSNQLLAVSGDAYERAMQGLAEPVWEDFRANSLYWKRFEGPVAEVSGRVNDVYLKTNRQTDGVKSYGRMVDLLLADFHMRQGRAEPAAETHRAES